MLRKLPFSQTLIFFVSISIILSLSLGTIATISYSPTFAHTSDDVYGFMGTQIKSLTNAQLQSLSMPSNVACGANACISSIDSATGEIYCEERATKIFGAGECINTPVCIPGAKGCPKSDSWKCTHKTEPKLDCEGDRFHGYNNGGSAAALDKARESAASKCCPAGTVMKSHSSLLSGYKGYYCEGQ